MEKKPTVIIICPETGKSESFFNVSYEGAYALVQDADDVCNIAELRKTFSEEEIAESKKKVNLPGEQELVELNEILDRHDPKTRVLLENTVGVNRLTAISLKELTKDLPGKSEEFIEHLEKAKRGGLNFENAFTAFAMIKTLVAFSNNFVKPRYPDGTFDE